jgi:undecaprenyl pyrophosphate phosphatase UppP
MRSPILNKQRFVATRDLFNNRCRRRHPYATLAQGQFRDRDLRFTLWIILATIPIGIAGLLLAKLLNTCNSPLRNVSVIGWACVVMAASSGFRRNSCPSSTHD